jgi:DNA mismatch repair protein PMS2
MSVVTRAESSSVASLITFDKEGTIVSSQVTARSVGTTVTVNNIFYSMPVRRKEFEKNIKREFGKMLQLLTAYCLTSRKVR